MRHMLKLLNDTNASELKSLDAAELTRLEVLCEQWARLTHSERTQRLNQPYKARTAKHPAAVD